MLNTEAQVQILLSSAQTSWLVRVSANKTFSKANSALVEPAITGFKYLLCFELLL